MPTLDVLTIQRISAADRARIEAIDPAIRLTDAGGWFDGEYRDTWPAFSATRFLAPGAVGQGTREERDRDTRTGGGDPGRLAVPARSARPRDAAEMVPSAPGRREQSAYRRSVGQRRAR